MHKRDHCVGPPEPTVPSWDTFHPFAMTSTIPTFVYMRLVVEPVTSTLCRYEPRPWLTKTPQLPRTRPQEDKLLHKTFE